MSGCIILIAGKSKDMPDGVKNAIKVNIKNVTFLWKFHILLDGDSEKCEHDGRTSELILEHVARTRNGFILIE